MVIGQYGMLHSSKSQRFTLRDLWEPGMTWNKPRKVSWLEAKTITITICIKTKSSGSSTVRPSQHHPLTALQHTGTALISISWSCDSSELTISLTHSNTSTPLPQMAFTFSAATPAPNYIEL